MALVHLPLFCPQINKKIRNYPTPLPYSIIWMRSCPTMVKSAVIPKTTLVFVALWKLLLYAAMQDRLSRFLLVWTIIFPTKIFFVLFRNSNPGGAGPLHHWHLYQTSQNASGPCNAKIASKKSTLGITKTLHRKYERRHSRQRKYWKILRCLTGKCNGIFFLNNFLF